MGVEIGHVPKWPYVDASGDEHMNGSNLYDVNENPIAQNMTFAPAAGSPGVCNVAIQIQDAKGNPIASVFELEWWLSDSPTGAGVTGTSASGTVGAGASGTDVYGKVSKKAGDSLTDATGKYILLITDTAKTGFYVCLGCPGTGVTFVSSQLQAANYG